MDKFVLILFVSLGVLALVLGCVLMVGMMNDMEKWEENNTATDTSSQAYSTAQPLEATVTGLAADKGGAQIFVLGQGVFVS